MLPHEIDHVAAFHHQIIMQNLLIFLFFLFHSLIYGQQYVNKIIPTEFGNVNSTIIFKIQNHYVLDGIFDNNQSCLLKLDDDLDLIQHFIYDSTVFSRAGINTINHQIYIYSKNRFLSNGLELLKIDENFKKQKLSDIITGGEYNFPTSSIQIDGCLYNSFTYKENGITKIGVNKSDTLGANLWTKYFETNIGYSYLWDLCPTKTKEFLAIYKIRYKNDFNTFVKVIKIDTSGSVKWESDSLIGISGAAPICVTELSDSSIFVTFTKDMHKDPEYVLNWHPYPPTYIWLDKEGRKVREDILKIPRNRQVYVSEVKTGQENYFYIFGGLRHLDTDDDYGFITKYANNGDTIWTHRYRHPAFDSPVYIYYINDIIEEDNGDITALGSITPVGGKTEVWAFRINSEGCYGTQTCDDLVLSTHSDAGPAYGMTVYPNPTTGILHISGLPPGDDVLVRLYSIDGRPVLSRRGQVTELDISRLAPGIYLLQADTGTSSRTVKIMKR